MRNQRLFVGVLVLVLALLVSAGCGGGGEEEPMREEPQGAPDGAKFSTIDEGVLRVGSDIPFPPFEFREGGELTGFDVELVNEMAKRLELETNWVDTAFDTIFTQLAAGRFDMVASATTITKERARQVNFTQPYYAAQQAVTINKNRTPNVTSVDDLGSDDVVAVQKGTTGEVWARGNLPDGVNIRSFPEAPDTYTALEAGNVTAVIFDEPSAVTEAEKRENLDVVDTIDTGERYGFAVDPRNEALLLALNDALEEIKQDGTYERIYDQFELPPGGNILQVEK